MTNDVTAALQAEAQRRADADAALAKSRAAAEEADRAARAAELDNRSPREKHDAEMAAHQRWVNNPKTASYYWAIVQDGKVVLTEWDGTCDCPDKAEFDAAGHTKKMSEWPAPPYTLAAYPISTANTLPSAADLAVAGHVFLIEPGDTPIWQHRVRWVHYADGRPSEEDDTLVFGVKKADGTEQVTTVDHLGNVVAHASHEDALAHPSAAT